MASVDYEYIKAIKLNYYVHKYFTKKAPDKGPFRTKYKPFNIPLRNQPCVSHNNTAT